MKSTVKKGFVIFCISFFMLLIAGNECKAEELKDENPQRMETAYGVDENGNYFEIDDTPDYVEGISDSTTNKGRAVTAKVVNFNTKGNALTYYKEYGTNIQGYTNGLYGADAAYIGEEDGKVIFMLSGVVGTVDASEVQVLDYADVKGISYYIVQDGVLYHRIAHKVSQTSYSSLRNGTAPSYLNEDVKYYSYDGHYFYKKYATMVTDYQNQTRKNSVNPNKPYYNYYQFLPFRSRTEYTADEIYTIYNSKLQSLGLDSTSKLKNKGRYFVQYQNSYGVNALLVTSIASNESYWGTSTICKNKNNIFGWDAVDASPGESADTFASIQACIKQFDEIYMSQKYLRPGYMHYNGGFLGNKASGINVKYASDPYWGEKAANIAYTLDSIGDNKDYGTYTIGIKDTVSTDHTCVNVRAESNTSSSILYTTEKITNYAVLLQKVASENGYYKIQSDGVLNSDHTEINTASGQYNYGKMYAYILASKVKIVHEGEDISLFSLTAPKNVSAKYSNGKVTYTWKKVSNAEGYYVYRKKGSGSYTRVKNITSGDTVSYTDTNVEAGKEYTYTVRAYNKSLWSKYYTAGVSVTIPDSVTYTKYKTTTTVNYRSGAGTSYAKKGTLAKGTVISVEDGYSKTANGYTWVRFKLNSKTYYIAKKYLEKVITLSKPELVSAEYDDGVITFKWKKVSNAKGYYVYRKVSGGSYSKIATIKSGTTVTYKDSSITKGKTYIYTVKAYNGSNVGKYNSTGLSVKAQAAKTYTKYKTTTNVNYRSGAGTSYAKKGTLAAGTAINVEDGYSKTADGYTWVRFKLNSQNYYIAKKYLEKQ